MLNTNKWLTQYLWQWLLYKVRDIMSLFCTLSRNSDCRINISPSRERWRRQTRGNSLTRREVWDGSERERQMRGVLLYCQNHKCHPLEHEEGQRSSKAQAGEINLLPLCHSTTTVHMSSGKCMSQKRQWSKGNAL